MYFTDGPEEVQPAPRGPRFPNSGYFSIGPGGEFPSFTAAINHVNSLEVIGIGGFVFEVTAGAVFNETPPAITKVASEASPVIFVKVGTGANPIIRSTGTAAENDAIIKLNAVHYYTFDGIDLANATGTTAVEYGFYLSASQGRACGYNTIKNCQITLSTGNPNSKGIFAECGTGARHYANTYQNIAISGVNYGIHLLGNSSQYHYNELITSCQISNVNRNGILVPYGEGTVIENNQITARSGTTESFEGINFGGSAASATVTGNTIVGSSAANSVTGIIQTLGSSTISGNTVRGFSISGNSLIGIKINYGNAVVSGNTVRNMSSSRNLTGILIGSGVNNASVTANLVHSLSNTSTSTTGNYCTGIEAGGANTLLANNMVHSLTAASNTAPGVRGISTLAGTNLRIVYNTVCLSAPASHSNFSSAALYMAEANNNVELINNILANLSTPGSGTNGRATSIWKGAAGFTDLNPASNNNLFWSGNPDAKHLLAYAGGASYQTLLQYLLVSGGRDTDSLQESPPFTALTDPHIQPGVQTNLESAAQPLPDVLTDYDGEPRSSLHPDIGADEGAFGIANWSCAPESLDFGYVCAGGSPGMGAVTISNTGSVAVSFSASGFAILGGNAASFYLSDLPASFVIQPEQSQVINLCFAPSGAGPASAELSITDSASNNQVLALTGIGTVAAVHPYLADWEAELDGWISVNGSQLNSWHRGTACAYRGEGSVYVSSDGGQNLVYDGGSSSVVHLFRDMVLPLQDPRLLFNWLCQGSASDRMSVWIMPTNQSPVAGSLPAGMELGALLYGSGDWQYEELALPQVYAGQRIRLVFTWQNDAVGSFQPPAAVDNLRLLSTPVYPPAPQALTALMSDDGLALSWGAVNGANEYVVEASSDPWVGFGLLTRQSGTSCLIDTSPQKRFFRIRATE